MQAAAAARRALVLAGAASGLSAGLSACVGAGVGAGVGVGVSSGGGGAAGPAGDQRFPFVKATTHPALHLVGDSTLADKPDPPAEHPERGWGQLLRSFMKEPQRLVNHGANGRSTKRIVDEGRWAHVLSQVQAGDFVLIQFGHNDQKEDDPARYAPADTAFKAYLRQFISQLRVRGATPVLATPVVRRKFNALGKIENTLGRYPDALREVAAEQGVALIDMGTLTAQHLQALGPEASKREFMWLEPRQWKAFPQGRRDDTHYVEQGARATAALAARALSQAVPDLSAWFVL